MKCRNCGEPISKPHKMGCPNKSHFGVKSRKDDKK